MLERAKDSISLSERLKDVCRALMVVGEVSLAVSIFPGAPTKDRTR